MIRYPTTLAELEQLIDAEKDSWRGRAKERTDGFRLKGKYKEKSPIWSEIKVVYMRLQKGKCAFCERKLEDEWFGRAEQDVEHFRPKGAVKKWKVPKSLKKKGVKATPPVTGNKDPGYHLLPYHLLNYCAACKPCNSAIKKDYFPIQGVRNCAGDNPVVLNQRERHFLIYPIGDIDEDPEELISFNGISPYPAKDDQYLRHRALVTINFFNLDSRRKRKNLLRERAMMIVGLRSYLRDKVEAQTQAELDAAQEIIDLSISPSSPHTNCARSYVKLYEENPVEGEDFFRKAARYVSRIS